MMVWWLDADASEAKQTTMVMSDTRSRNGRANAVHGRTENPSGREGSIGDFHGWCPRSPPISAPYLGASREPGRKSWEIATTGDP